MRSVIFAFLILILPLAIVYPKQDLNSSRIDSETKEVVFWDFGKIKPGELSKHEFNFINNSGKSLIIKDVSTSCGCTVSEVKKKDLLPGESTIIEIKFDSKGYNGHIEQFVYVNIDSLDNPIIKIIIRALVEK